MSLRRRPLGRGRLLAVLSSPILVVGCVLPWFRAGSGDLEIPPVVGNAFDGPSILVFLVALATPALVTLPYASERPVGVDRWWAYAALAILGWAGLVMRAGDIVINSGGFATVTPDRAPGLWLTVIGLIMLSRAAWQISNEPQYF
jgi:hypothetical protein